MTSGELAAELTKSGAHVTPDGRVLPKVAAEILGIAERTLANQRAAGRGPPHYNLGRIWYRLSDLLSYIDQSRVEGEIKA